jgi:DNA-binding transcriptional LysR family regulator
MEFGQIEAFERVARLGSFTRAADDLNLTQPSISARIAGLEAEVGGPLFERGRRRLRLTPLGEIFLPYAERTLATLADGLQAAQSHTEGRLGQVTLASLDTSAMYMLPGPMQRFRSEYPAIDLTIKLRPNRFTIDMLYEGEATLGLIAAPLWDKGIQILAHFQERVRAVASPQHGLAIRQQEQGTLMLEDFYDHTLYRMALAPRITALVEGIAEHGRRGSGGAVVSIPTMMARHLLISGMGVAFLPENFVQSSVDDGRLVFLEVEDMPLLYNELLLVSLKGRELDRPNAAFVRMIRAQWHHILVG